MRGNRRVIGRRRWLTFLDFVSGESTREGIERGLIANDSRSMESCFTGEGTVEDVEALEPLVERDNIIVEGVWGWCGHHQGRWCFRAGRANEREENHDEK